MDVNDPVWFRIKNGCAREPVRIERQPRLLTKLRGVAASVGGRDGISEEKAKMKKQRKRKDEKRIKEKEKTKGGKKGGRKER